MVFYMFKMCSWNCGKLKKNWMEMNWTLHGFFIITIWDKWKCIFLFLRLFYFPWSLKLSTIFFWFSEKLKFKEKTSPRINPKKGSCVIIVPLNKLENKIQVRNSNRLATIVPVSLENNHAGVTWEQSCQHQLGNNRASFTSEQMC